MGKRDDAVKAAAILECGPLRWEIKRHGGSFGHLHNLFRGDKWLGTVQRHRGEWNWWADTSSQNCGKSATLKRARAELERRANRR